MAKKKTKYVILTRNSDRRGIYEQWTIAVELRCVDGSWDSYGSNHNARWLTLYEAKDWHMLTGLVLRKGAQRWIKITYLKSGVKWEWVGKAGK